MANLVLGNQYPAAFYLFWFFKTYEAGERGWKLVRTPNGDPVCEQDHFFSRCLEIIARTMNNMLSEESKRGAMRKT